MNTAIISIHDADGTLLIFEAKLVSVSYTDAIHERAYDFAECVAHYDLTDFVMKQHPASKKRPLAGARQNGRTKGAPLPRNVRRRAEERARKRPSGRKGVRRAG